MVCRWATNWMILFLGWEFFLHQRVQKGTEDHLTSHTMGKNGSFFGVKRQWCEANNSPTFSADLKEWVELYFYSPIRLHDMVLS